MAKFKMEDMGDVSLVLGMQVTRDCEKGTPTISAEKYTNSFLDRSGVADYSLARTSGYGSELSAKQPEDTLLKTE